MLLRCSECECLGLDRPQSAYEIELLELCIQENYTPSFLLVMYDQFDQTVGVDSSLYLIQLSIACPTIRHVT